MKKKEEERKYISLKRYNGKTRYQLVMPSYNPRVPTYITTRDTIEELRKIRDEILPLAPYTEAELKEIRRKYKKPVREPRIEDNIQLTRANKYKVVHKKQYGTYETIEEARRVRDKLIQYNWDNDLAGIPVKRRNRKFEDRYIYHEPSGYFIRRDEKQADGSVRRPRYDSNIPTLEEARRLRDEWEELEWDWGNL